MRERRNSYRVVVERSDGKRLLGKPRRGRELLTYLLHGAESFLRS